MNPTVAVSRKQLIGILLANGLLWSACILVSRNLKLGPPAAISIFSIAMLLNRR